MKLRERLSEIEPDMFARLKVMEGEAKKILEYSQGGSHITYTPHGLSHITAVEQSYDWLLSDSDIDGFNSAEILCLLCATFFHDTLMIPKKLGQESLARKNHASKAINFLLQNRDKLTLGIHEADVISTVIKGHGEYSLSSLDETVVLGSQKVEVRKLAACLSLGDICHADESRAPEIVFKYFDLDDESASHWRRHMQISGITRDREVLLVSALVFSDEGEMAIKDYKKAISRQLEIVKPYFSDKLSPLRSIELKIRRLETPLDRPLRFRPDMASILDILVEGVYQRDDVFVRELIQNSLDACYLRQATSMRRGEGFEPNIVVTSYEERQKLRAVRIDDNGVGMDINDLEDTVLWLGRTSADKESVKALLEVTSQKSLIATFGIGLLSCFRSAKEITIRTCKEGRSALECTMQDIVGSIKPKESLDKSTGTTVIVTLEDEVGIDLDLEDSIGYYVRHLDQANLILNSLEWADSTLNYSRNEIFRSGKAQGEIIGVCDYPEGWFVSEFRGENYRGYLTVDQEYLESGFGEDGTLQILNEGIFVTEEDSDLWFPNYAKFCSGYINFAAKVLDLSASRDNVVQNSRFSQIKEELASKVMCVIRDLVEISRSGRRKDAALLLAHAFDQSEKRWRRRILKELDNFHVLPYQSPRTTRLIEIVKRNPTTVFLEYRTGKFVEDLCSFDGKKLFHKPDDIVELQARLLHQDEKLVIHADRTDERDNSILEASMLSAYFTSKGIKPKDLNEEVIVEGQLRSKPVPGTIRNIIGSNVKFVEIFELPNKRAWKVGKETWFNVANPTMGKVYDALISEVQVAERQTLIKAFILMLSHDFDGASENIIELLS